MKKRVQLAVLLLALGALMVVSPGSQRSRAAGPWYVAPGGDDVLNDCLSAGAPCATINGAIGKASPGDTIYVAVGTYAGTGNEVVLIDKDITLSGGWNASFAVQDGTSTIDGQDSRRGMVVNNGVTAIVERFTVQNGDAADDYGAGIQNLGTLTLNNSAVTGSRARWGGGIHNNGALTLNSSTIQSNTCTIDFIYDSGGGIYNQGTAILDNSTVANNAADDGGGINNGGTLDLHNSIIRDNTVKENGAGIYNGGTLHIENSAISGNTSPLPYPGGSGGGIANHGTLTLDSSTVSGNMSRGGGGISNSGSMALNSSTVSGNRAVTGGGGISTGESPATLQNTILASNVGSTPDCSGNIESLGYNLIGISSGCVFTPTVGDLTFVSPGLGPLIGSPGYHPLLPNSLAVDAGNPAGCTDHLGSPLNTDQRGAARVGRCDIGAYEYTPPGSAVHVSAVGGTPQRTPPLTAFGSPLQALVLDSMGSPVHDATVTFYAPASGAGGVFADNGTFTTTAVTDGCGIAAAAAFTANELTGDYTVTATVAGVATPTSFLLGNAGWYVAPGGNDTNDCQSPTMPCATIDGPLAKTGFVAGDTVLVASGVYVGTGDEVVLLDKSARLLGGWDGAFTAQSGVSAVDGERSRRCMAVGAGATASVERFVLQNAFAGVGGGVYNEGVLTLTDVSIRDNSSCFGAGLWNEGTLTAINITMSENVCEDYSYTRFTVYNASSGVMTLDNAIVSDNVSLLGIWNYGMLTMADSTVRGNSDEGESGTLSNWGGTVFMDRCTISDNRARGGAGIIVGWDGTTIVQNSTVSGNTAWSGCGGGVSVDSGALTMINTTISGNAASSGGGICDENGTVALNNTTVSGNRATGYEGSGGGIYNDQGTVTLRNSILAGNATSNTGPDCSGTVGSAGYNLIGNSSGCSFAPATGDQVGADPKLGPLEGAPGYHPLPAGSPAINAGNPSGCIDHAGAPLVIDQRGMPRVGRCDVGAYEASLVADKQVVGTYAPGARLDYTVTLHNEAASDIAGVTVTDTLPGSLTYVPGSFSAGSGVGGESGNVVTWTGTVAAGSGVTISFGATVDGGVLSCTAITNKVTIGGQGYQVERQVTGKAPCGVCNLAKHAGNPVLSVGAGGSWDSDDVWGPAVVQEGGTYRMWYSGYDGTNLSRIGLATSSDGVHWYKSASNPVLSPTKSWEANGIQVGSVVSDGGVYEMWYTGYDPSWVGRIGYATSADGVVWVKHYSNPVLDVGAPGSWEDGDVMAPTVLKEGSTYYMWYAGRDDTASRIGQAYSGDGVAWIRNPNNPVVDIGMPGAWDWLDVYSPSVVKVGMERMLWYSGETLPQAWQTGYVASTCGSDWGSSQMVIPEGGPGAFDAYSADYASIVVESTGYRIWYSGHDGSGYTIGYATADLCSESGAVQPPYAVYLPIVLRSWDEGSPCRAYYGDSFGDPSSGWPVGEDNDHKLAYTGGQYQIWLKKPSKSWMVTPGAKATDFAVAVSARRVSGSGGAYGIIFGINDDWSELYEVILESNSYSIWKYDHGWSSLRGWTSSGYINGGTGWNRLKVIREGDDIAIYVNNHHLTTITDDSFTGFRRIGLVAYAFSSGPIDARFDDFALYPASCGPGAAGVAFEMGAPEIHRGPDRSE